ncbi:MULTISPECIES: tRNA cyclic N6-threonylcarbamoyladenosine(37) synthase TcdA [unclassified Shewanella]|uniref:tRNA cyclic N6-threonylcarbamoyladenosine(37) synthase TcdA n=1 Tax=unclassified Shewanella TaxID=196818 RepID=UPI000C835946|nr:MULTISPECIES: tRNA cyclic N6-threonylcarbamoyladenosine(37) synthase TcdA [unclassified Shewanella]MDO6620243.1 tRNA cyclic N6-threonylcarbamoyladenosine(37) synthase TcdA [Shewanella sp. 6_MG-2023]MDO6638580.1 tRNA cyclic N6-threonylcarbamoyladenosine(37) synthase TcdA [Shewanella sp. 5_MG-2023]MDO6679521.1 tRNA cyclic N6-threonylcarbamoyladenosine(37) synthase TcdA [Shewanella sp. 4_MG-2023]MDO6774603.1 tRNA cyclic N6-threonylcarbamoyladenosine(37) synthase TcdA [Shewanella sp. 3_MG-2023]
MSESYLNRFGGIGRLYGQAALENFANAHVVIIGIGGVGTWVAESLARSGIGQITLIDLDDICVTNTNRQSHAIASTIGQSKVEVMAQRIIEINPECVVNEVEDFITVDNLAEHLGSKASPLAIDYVVDCIDAVKQKAALIAWCKRNKLKIVTVGGAGGQTDPTQIQLTDLAKTYQDPLLAKVRNILRREYNFSKNVARRFAVDAVFSTQQLVYPQNDGSVCSTKNSADGSMRMDCASGFGAVTMVTGTFGFIAASRVLAKLAAK